MEVTVEGGEGTVKGIAGRPARHNERPVGHGRDSEMKGTVTSATERHDM